MSSCQVMAQNDNSWSQGDNSWRKTTCHGGHELQRAHSSRGPRSSVLSFFMLTIDTFSLFEHPGPGLKALDFFGSVAA